MPMVFVTQVATESEMCSGAGETRPPADRYTFRSL
jgi:hypothetical protein